MCYLSGVGTGLLYKMSSVSLLELPWHLYSDTTLASRRLKSCHSSVWSTAFSGKQQQNKDKSSPLVHCEENQPMNSRCRVSNAERVYIFLFSHQFMITLSNENIFRVTVHLRGEFTGPRTGQWCGALMFSLICVWINGWVNSGEAGYLRRYRAHYDVTVM